MSFKTILLHLTNDEKLEASISVALNLAAENSAHIVGLYTIAPVTPPTSFMGYIPPEFIERTRGIEAENAKQACERLTAKATAAGVEFSCVQEEGYAPDVIQKHALTADLVILGQIDPSNEKSAQYQNLADELVVGCPCPVLTVPYAGNFEKFGSHILVGWNNTREASKALRGALPFIKKATKVTLLNVNPTSDQSIGNDAAKKFLERHGATVQVKIGHWPDVGVGNALLDALVDYEADMLVMGAYGHSRLREMILGGATQEILGHMTAPVLFAH
ncbi:universal stress protein [Sneathiella aquimaris]|uniref:universal stress protein n=1 Tax=Sneathiella aquimaris TaxID=2599305 RepID=UPI00146F1470|nr:universal stress protein [Sneathiella aquimaris]